MAHFVLVHGTGHGAWCWRDVIPALVERGHTARAIDLPGSGADRTPVDDTTLDAYAAAILKVLDRPSILVGHSAGGFPITLAAERDPSRIARLVYLAAYVPQTGRSLVEIKGDATEQPLKGAFDMAADRKSFRFKPERIEENLYHDCPPGTVELARALLSWQAMEPQTTAITVDTSLALPRSAIITTRDNTIPPEHQRQMTQGFAAKDVHEIDSGHSPFFSDPETLADLLAEIADAT